MHHKFHSIVTPFKTSFKILSSFFNTINQSRVVLKCPNNAEISNDKDYAKIPRVKLDIIRCLMLYCVIDIINNIEVALLSANKNKCVLDMERPCR